LVLGGLIRCSPLFRGQIYFSSSDSIRLQPLTRGHCPFRLLRHSLTIRLPPTIPSSRFLLWSPGSGFIPALRTLIINFLGAQLKPPDFFSFLYFVVVFFVWLHHVMSASLPIPVVFQISRALPPPVPSVTALCPFFVQIPFPPPSFFLISFFFFFSATLHSRFMYFPLTHRAPSPPPFVFCLDAVFPRDFIYAFCFQMVFRP